MTAQEFQSDVVDRLARIETAQKTTHDGLECWAGKVNVLQIKMAVVETKIGSPRKVAVGVSAGVSSAVAIIGGVVVFVINWLKGD